MPLRAFLRRAASLVLAGLLLWGCHAAETITAEPGSADATLVPLTQSPAPAITFT